MSSAPLADHRARGGGFKRTSTLDGDEGRRSRQETTLQLRKAKRDERLAKRRHQIPAAAAAAAGGGGVLVENNNAARTAFGNGGDDSVLADGLKALPLWTRDLHSSNPAVLTQATAGFRKLLSIEKNPPIQQVIDARVVPRFLEFLQRDDIPVLQLEAAWALTNIASGTSAQTKVVVDANATPLFVRLLTSPHDEVQEQAVWALGNIAGDSPAYRDLVLRAGALIPLLQLIRKDAKKLSLLRNAAWTVSNFCRGTPQPDFDQVRVCLPTLAQLIHNNDEEVLTDACWAFSYLSDGTNDKIQAVIDEAGVCRRLIELLFIPNSAIQTPSLRAIGNIVTGNDSQTQFIIDHNALPALLALLSSPKKGIRKEACWALSNIMAGNKEQIQAVINNNIIPPLIHLLTNAEFDIRNEAAWAISNATDRGDPQQIKFLVQQGCIRPLCDLLTGSDDKMVQIALDGLEHILQVGNQETLQDTFSQNEMALLISEADGLDKIEDLQQHENETIYEKSVSIIETYFGVEDEEEIAALAPTESGGQFGFGMDATQGGFDFSGGPHAAV